MDSPWEWRRAYNGWLWASDRRDGVTYFHAFDVNDNGACEVMLGLAGTVEQPTEGSTLCPDCIEFVKANPAGRDRRMVGATFHGKDQAHG